MGRLKIGFISLGCPKNQVDTEVMLHDLVKAGYEITGEEIEADIIIINTCAFIESAKQESIENILDAAWLKKKKLRALIVTGCMAQRYSEQILKELPEVDAVVGVSSLHEITKAVETVEKGEKYFSVKPIEEYPLGGERIITTPDYYGYLKIAEGCDNRCSYCAIPQIRGSFRSRKIEDIVSEAKDLEALGVKELILVAQDTSRYGYDIYGEYKLAALLGEILSNTDIPWIRLLYCYPDKITRELVYIMRENKRILPYIDMPVQHISDRVLSKMNRHGGSEAIINSIEMLRNEIPDITIRSTAIVGFPGETEEEFEQLCGFVEKVRFERFGVFKYSQEEDTAAALFEDQIDEQTKQDRYDALMEIQLLISEQQNNSKIGKHITVLCEGWDPVAEVHFGRSEADAPEIDGKVYFSSPERIGEGEFVEICITDTIDYDIIGEII